MWAADLHPVPCPPSRELPRQPAKPSQRFLLVQRKKSCSVTGPSPFFPCCAVATPFPLPSLVPFTTHTHLWAPPFPLLPQPKKKGTRRRTRIDCPSQSPTQAPPLQSFARGPFVPFLATLVQRRSLLLVPTQPLLTLLRSELRRMVPSRTTIGRAFPIISPSLDPHVVGPACATLWTVPTASASLASATTRP